MNISLATAKKERPATDGGFSNDNADWLTKLPVGTVFYCKWRSANPSYYVQEFTKAWQQGPVVRLEDANCDNPKFTQRLVEAEDFTKLYALVHIYEEEDTG